MAETRTRAHPPDPFEDRSRSGRPLVRAHCSTTYGRLTARPLLGYLSEEIESEAYWAALLAYVDQAGERETRGDPAALAVGLAAEAPAQVSTIARREGGGSLGLKVDMKGLSHCAH